MHFCIPIPCFFGKMDFCRAIERVAGLGFDAAETYHWEALDRKAAAHALRDNGVELVSLCTSEFRMTDPAMRRLWLDGLKASCDAALELGAHKLITQVGPDTGRPRREQHDAIVETFRQALPILEQSGVTVMPEPLNTLVDHKGYYLWSAQEGFEIIREVNSPHVRLIFDLYHQQIMEGNLIPAVTENLPLIAHLHAAGHPGRRDLQTGETDYENVFAAIDRAGYTGCCGLEYSPLGDAEESLRACMARYGRKRE